jgi:hypothetical protein
VRFNSIPRASARRSIATSFFNRSISEAGMRAMESVSG